MKDHWGSRIFIKPDNSLLGSMYSWMIYMRVWLSLPGLTAHRNVITSILAEVSAVIIGHVQQFAFQAHYTA
jgi:hypothetical protein